MHKQNAFYAEGAWLGAGIETARQNGTVFRHLANQAAGRTRDVLLELYRRERYTARLLQGLRLLRGDNAVTHQPQPELRQEPTALLREALAACRRQYGAFAARTGESEWGMVYQTMAESQQRELADILSVLGTWAAE